MTAVDTLSQRLFPWLTPALEQFETARRAGSLGHAWLISGPAGVGKINLALVLARRLLGEDRPVAVLDAAAGLAALPGRHEPTNRHPDLHWLYPEEEKETISIDQVRDLIEILTLTAHRGGAKIAIVEPAEALTAAASNALLKTLEEPSAESYLLLLSHQPGRLPATVRSRCQHVTIRPPGAASIATWLGVAPAMVAEAERSVGTAPLPLAAAIQASEVSKFKELERTLAEVCQDKSDSQSVAQAWAKGDTRLALGWLQRRLYQELRARLAARGKGTEITVPATSTLHNAWRPLPERTLFDAYDRAEKLLNQVGSGLNIELALQAMLSELVVNRGRS